MVGTRRNTAVLASNQEREHSEESRPSSLVTTHEETECLSIDGPGPMQRLLERERQLRLQLEEEAVQDRILELERQVERSRVRRLRNYEGDKDHDETEDGRSNSRATQRSSTTEESLRRRSRAYSSDEDEGQRPAHRQRSRRTGPRAKPPPDYRGRSIREHKDFFWACELVFRDSPDFFQEDADKILMALQYLKGEPADAYKREEKRVGKDLITWDEFEKLLLDEVADPVNRLFTVAQRHQDAMHGATQKAAEFVTYLESLEEELEPYTENQKLQILLTKLHPDLRRRITDHQTVPTTRLELTRLATRLQENARHAKDRSAGPAGLVEQPHDGRTVYRRNDRHDRNDRNGHYNRNDRNDRRQARGDAWKPPASSDGPATTVNRMPITGSGLGPNQGDAAERPLKCYNCGKPGHISRECRTRLRANAAAAKNSRAP